jgi:hypothetical protein
MLSCCPCIQLSGYADEEEEDGCFPKIPITYKELKYALRTGLNAEGRLYWWPYLPLLIPGVLVSEYPNLEQISISRFEWAKNRFEPDAATNASASSVSSDRTAEIMNLVNHLHDLEEPALVHPLIDILVLMIPRLEMCFKATCDVLARPDWFISPTAVSHRLKLFTFRELIKEYIPKVAATLERIGALGAEFLNLIFVELFKSLMPFPYVARIIDTFLLEGSKVLHRYGLGLIYLNRDIVNMPECTSGKAFWEELRKRCHDAVFDFDHLSVNSFHLGRCVYHMQLIVTTLYSANCDDCVVHRGRNLFGGGIKLQRKVMGTHAGIGREKMGESAKLPLNIGSKEKKHAPKSSFALDKVSKIIDAPSAARLRMFLPESSNIEGFKLVFSTARDGWNLDTLYKRTVNMSPCIIVLRSLQQHVVVGAYVPVPISPPSNNVRGNGTAFCFRLYGDTSACYRWESHTKLPVAEGTAATRDQFALCTEQGIIIGGSASHGTNALRIDAELMTCYSGYSDTYSNPPLAPEEEVQPFVVGACSK